MIYASFKKYGSYETDSLNQWDKNQTLTVQGLDLESNPEVRFSNFDMQRAIVKIGSYVDGVLTVGIPDSLLQSAYTIRADICIREDNRVNTIETVLIPVIPGVKPEDYVLDTGDEVYSFVELESKVANAIPVETFNQTVAGLVDKPTFEETVADLTTKEEFSEGVADLVSNEKLLEALEGVVSNETFEATLNNYAHKFLVDQEATDRIAGDNALSNRINNIIAGGQSTEGNTELLDIRTGADGSNYPTAGQAVRTQISNIINGLYLKGSKVANISPTNAESICGNDIGNLPVNSIYIVNEESGVANLPTDDGGLIITLSKTDSLYSGSTQILFSFNKTLYFRYYRASTWRDWTTVGDTETDTTLTEDGKPADAKATGDRLTAVETAQTQINDDLSALEDATTDTVFGDNYLNPNATENGVLVVNGEKVTVSPNDTRLTTDYIPVSTGDIIHYVIINENGIFFGTDSVNVLRVVYFDDDKGYVSTATYQQDFAVPEGAKYMRCSVVNNNARRYCITKNDVVPTDVDSVPEYVAPYKTMKHEGDIRGLISDVSALKNKVHTNVNHHIIDCWGDSRTEMIVNAGTAYSDYLNNLLGADYIVANYGISSQDSGMCAMRLGSNEVFLTLEGNKVPSTKALVNFTDLKCTTGTQRNVLAFSPNAPVRCEINGVKGQLIRASTSDKTRYGFTRDADGTEVTVHPLTKVVVDDKGSKSHICIFWWGKNDFANAGSESAVVNGIQDNYRGAVEYIGHDKFLILGETCSLETSYESGGVDRLRVEAINNALSVSYPDNFIDINAYLASEQALSDVGLTPTAQDLANIAKGLPCESLMVHSTDASDTVHPNEKGREAVAICIYRFMQAKGWI